MDNKENKELDLLDVLNSIGVGLKNCGLWVLKGIEWLLRLVYRCKFICLFFIILFGFLCYWQNRTKIYRGESDLKVSAFPAYTIKNLLEPLHLQCVYADSSLVASKLGLTVDEASKITNIEAFDYVDMFCDGTPDYVDFDQTWNATDTTMALFPGKLRVRIECIDTALFPKLSDAIINAISNSTQVKKEVALRISQLDEKIEAVDYEIMLLDSLRKKEYFERGKDVKLNLDKTVMLNEREMKLYHGDMLNLGKIRQELTWERNIYNQGLVFENNFEVNPLPINRWTKTYPKFIMIGLFFGILTSIIYTYRKSISSFFNKES